MPTFTREQKIAQSADRHLAVTAGAGTGKTSVLVQRFVHLLFDDSTRADVRQITAITFTRKAAAEMHRRISQEIEKLLADPSKKHQWGRIKAVRERFSSANISTIHSFCARLLREFPIEAGVNPNFTELEEHEGALIKEHAIMDTLEAWLEEKKEEKGKKAKEKKTTNTAASEIVSEITGTEPNSDEIPDETDEKQLAARRVWMLFGKETLLKMLQTLLQSAERFNELDALYRKQSIDAMLKMSEELFVVRFFTAIEQYLSTLDTALGALHFNAFTQTTRTKLEELASALASINNQVQSLISSHPEEHSSQDTSNPIPAPNLTWRNAEDIWHRIETTVLANGAISSTKGTMSGSSVRENTEKNFLNKKKYLLSKADAEILFATIKKMADVLPNHPHDRAMQEIARILLDIARDAWKLVREEKERLGALDFDDLEIKADVLLDNPEVCDKLRMNTRFLMIDEFQDTNELQYRIAKKLIRHLGQSPPQSEEISASGTNLFIVGDPKQSIYRFRGADVRVFSKAKRDIEALNGRLLDAGQLGTSFRLGEESIIAQTQSEAQGNIGLRATFRLLPEIAAFVNRVAGDQLSRTKTEFDVEYQDIVCGVANSTLRGTVTMLLARYPYKNNTEGNNDEYYLAAEQEYSAPNEEESASSSQSTEFLSEARLLAEYLRAIAEGTTATPVFVRSDDGTLRAATYNDMMILMRSRSGMEPLLTALRRCGVPFTVIGGRGFYERQEILDVRSFLLFLQNVHDDIALAAVLRSPFYGVSDTELYAISRTEVSTAEGSKTSSLWERLKEYSSQVDAGNDSTAKSCNQALRAFTMLSNLLPLAAQLPIPTLVRTILEQTAWRGMIAADERFDQIEANLEKLLVLARKYENKGFRNLYDFAEELRRLALYAFNEGEADADAGKNAVQIMTIHGAKGLEAPIVALYNTNAKSGGIGDGLSFDSALGMSFKMLRARENGTMEYIPTPLYTLASEKDTLADNAEAKRLLYVALTRPKDHLIISAKGYETATGAMKKPAGFFAMIQESLGVEERNLFHEPYLAQLQESLEALVDEKIVQREISFAIPIYRTREQFLVGQVSVEQIAEKQSKSPHPSLLLEGEESRGREEKQANVTSIPLPPLLLGTLSSSVEGDFYSASQLRLFIHNPDEYERLYRLGLPPADDEGFFIGSAAGTGDDGDETLGTTAGESIHAVLQHLPLWMNAAGEVQPSEFQRTIDRILPRTQRIFTPTLHARLQRETQAVAATPLVKRYAETLFGAKYEYPITMPIDHDFLIGTMDVLVQTPSGALEIWDWKTNRVGSARDMDRLLTEYRLQLEIYAYMASFLALEQDTLTTRLLFTRRASQTVHDDEWTRTLEWTRLDIEAIGSKIRQIIGTIRQRSYGLLSEFA